MIRMSRVAVALLAAALAGCGTAADRVDAATPSSAAPSSSSSAPLPSSSAPPTPEGPEAELAAVQAGYVAPTELRAPAEFGACPDAADELSADTGTRIVYWQGELPRAPEGCQWADVNTVTGQTFPEQRYSLNIGFYTGVDPANIAYFEQINTDIPCTVVTPASDVQAALTRCTSVSTDGSGGVGDVTYAYLQPDASGAGIWQLSVTIGSQYPGDQLELAADGLAAVASVATAAYGTP